MLGDKALAIADLAVASPQAEIIAQMKRLKKELSARTCLANGKQARTIAGIKENWEHGKGPPDWQVVHRLVAIGDEASIAAPADVAAMEAALYSAHVSPFPRVAERISPNFLLGRDDAGVLDRGGGRVVVSPVGGAGGSRDVALRPRRRAG